MANSMNEKERRQVKKALKFLFFSSRGGRTRLRIVKLLEGGAFNANQIAEALGLDYKTVMHHLEVLGENNLVVKDGEKYGARYRLSSEYKLFKDILEELEKEAKYS
jgi:DNA-binding transcriptional ArsR family regulator